MQYPTQFYIDGALTTGSGHKDVVNPATEDRVTTVSTAGFDDVERALQAARAAFPGWAATSIAARQAWMRKLRDVGIAYEAFLRVCVHLEMGIPWAQTHEDWDRLVVSLEFYAQEIARVQDYGLADRAGSHTHRMVHEPAGVAVAFLAWNFPLLNLAFKIAPAMAAGCPIIIRPSEATPPVQCSGAKTEPLRTRSVTTVRRTARPWGEVSSARSAASRPTVQASSGWISTKGSAICCDSRAARPVRVIVCQ